MRVGLLAFACFDLGDGGFRSARRAWRGRARATRVAGFHRFLVALEPVRDLFVHAKDLFIAAIDGKGPQLLTAEASWQGGIGGYSALLPALHQLRRDCRAEHPSVALPTSLVLFICAKT